MGGWRVPRWALAALIVAALAGVIAIVVGPFAVPSRTDEGAADMPSQPSQSPLPSAATPATTGSTLPAAVTPVRYYQFDKKWAKQRYGPNSDDTVRRWGCGPAALAMVISTLADPTVDPRVAAAWSDKHGYFTHAPESGKTEPAYFADFASSYGIAVRQLNTKDLRTSPPASSRSVKLRAQQAVREGNWVIALMGKGLWTTEAHYVLWYRAEGDEVWIADSNSMREDKAHNTFDTFSQTMIRLWVVEVADAGVRQ
ncbi:MAG TPA: C39 family peptidase [Propionicimonas sp.]|nr:C39 family peptidase [Propionicimonas sp.]